MAKVRMVHPNLPDQPIEVTQRAAAMHAASGWVPAEELPAPEAPEPAAPKPAGEQAPETETTETTPSGRRAKKE